MKILIISVIALVVPLFFALMFAMNAYNRLSVLRERCRSARAQLGVQLEAADPSAEAGPGAKTLSDAYLQAASEYNRERNRCLSRLVAAVFRFDEAPLKAHK